MIDNHRAIGGKTWCARPLDKEGRIIEDNDLYRSFVLCRILADRIRVPWFDHTQDEEGAVALTYLSKRLIKDGTEYKQLSEAVEKTRFPIQEDGSIKMFTSTGYRILDDARSIILSKKAQQPAQPDAEKAWRDFGKGNCPRRLAAAFLQTAGGNKQKTVFSKVRDVS